MTLEAIENRVTQLESMSKSSSILQSAEALAQKGAILCFIGRSEEAVVALGRSLTLTKYSNREQREQRNSTMHALRETLVSCEKSDDRWKVEQDVYSKVAQDIRQAIQAGLDEDFEKCISLWTDLLSQHSPQTLKSSGQRVENIERILDIAVRGSQKTQKNLDMLFQGGDLTKINSKSSTAPVPAELEDASAHKERGNVALKAGDYDAALASYQSALTSIASFFTGKRFITDTVKTQADKLILSVQLKLGSSPPADAII